MYFAAFPDAGLNLIRCEGTLSIDRRDRYPQRASLILREKTRAKARVRSLIIRDESVYVSCSNREPDESGCDRAFHAAIHAFRTHTSGPDEVP